MKKDQWLQEWRKSNELTRMVSGLKAPDGYVISHEGELLKNSLIKMMKETHHMVWNGGVWVKE